jgi:hypothetical protein
MVFCIFSVFSISFCMLISFELRSKEMSMQKEMENT